MSQQGAEANNDNVGAGLVAYRFENVEFQPLGPQLLVDGNAVDVEPRPLQVLAELLQRVNEVVTREELQEAVWQGRPTVDHVLANAISKLRAALGAAGAARITTVPRLGYRLAGPVQRVSALDKPQSLQAGQPVAGQESFVLERVLGKGGRGDVWLARHARLGQVQVFKFAPAGERLQALKREYTLYRVLRQELGARDDMAVLVEANFNVSPCFLRCDYAGRSLLEWEDSTHSLQAMSQAERLALFIQIARPVAAAHRVGVLHKDIKPGNVLIDGQPNRWHVRLTDFGSGRLLDPSRLQALNVTALGLTQTQTAQSDSNSGTLMYLAPEVMAGQTASMQSDVYALGVLLYQLLVADLRRPLASGWQRQVGDDLLCQDVAAATDGALESRLHSVNELIDRLLQLEQRHALAKQRAQEMEQAAHAQQQLQRVRARRPWVVTAVAAMLVGLTASLWMQHRVGQALRQAESSAQEAQAVNDYLTKDLIDANNVSREGAHRPPTMLDMLRRGAKAAGQRFAAQPRVEAAVQWQLGRTFHRMSSMSDAWPAYERALQLMQAQLPADDTRLLQAQMEYVLLLFDMNERTEAVALYQRIEKAAEARLVQAVDPLAALTANARAGVLWHAGHVAEGVAVAQANVQRLERATAAPLELRIEAHRVLATLLMSHGDLPASDAVLDKLRAKPFSDSPASAKAHNAVRTMQATFLRDAGKLKEAEAMLLAERALQAGSPQPSQWHLGYLDSELGHVYSKAQDEDAAAARYTLALGEFRAALGEDHQFPRITAMNIAQADGARGHHAAALAMLTENRPWFAKQRTQAYTQEIDALIARALIGLGRPDEALALLRTLPSPTPATPADKGLLTPWSVQAYTGMALIATGHSAEGKALLVAALPALQRLDEFPRSAADAQRWLRRAR